jgi:hypothetical protein
MILSRYRYRAWANVTQSCSTLRTKTPSLPIVTLIRINMLDPFKGERLWVITDPRSY